MAIQTILTTKNIKVGITIRSIDDPEWGDWKIISHYDIGIYEIRGNSGDKILVAPEYHFWEVVS